MLSCFSLNIELTEKNEKHCVQLKYGTIGTIVQIIYIEKICIYLALEVEIYLWDNPWVHQLYWHLVHQFTLTFSCFSCSTLTWLYDEAERKNTCASIFDTNRYNNDYRGIGTMIIVFVHWYILCCFFLFFPWEKIVWIFTVFHVFCYLCIIIILFTFKMKNVFSMPISFLIKFNTFFLYHKR